MSSDRIEKDALTDGVEVIQCSAFDNDHDDETKRQIESFLDVLASVSLAVAARQSESGQGLAE